MIDQLNHRHGGRFALARRLPGRALSASAVSIWAAGSFVHTVGSKIADTYSTSIKGGGGGVLRKHRAAHHSLLRLHG
jgi:hypothetical protein